MIEIRPAGPKGLGVFAKSLIPRGTRIFSEKPLLSLTQTQSSSEIYTLTRLLPPSRLSSLLSLSAHTSPSLTFIRWNQALFYTLKSLFKNFPFLLPRYCYFEKERGFGGKWSLREHVRILGVFRSNVFQIGEGGVGKAVFGGVSRINHECVPNSQGNWNVGMGRFNVHAVRDIEKDEEVSLSYLADIGALRERRIDKLREGYGFDCGCQACNLDSVAGKQGEENRVQMKTLLGEYAESVEGNGRCDEKELETMTKYLTMLEGEGIAGREIASMYLVAARLNEALGRMGEALKCAQRAEDIDCACLGVDHETYLATRNAVERLMARVGGGPIV